MLKIFAILAMLLGVAWAADRPRDYRDEVISALQIQRNNALDTVVSLNATLVEKTSEVTSLTEQLKNSDERVKKLNEELNAKVDCAPDSKDH